MDVDDHWPLHYVCGWPTCSAVCITHQTRTCSLPDSAIRRKRVGCAQHLLWPTHVLILTVSCDARTDDGRSSDTRACTLLMYSSPSKDNITQCLGSKHMGCRTSKTGHAPLIPLPALQSAHQHAAQPAEQTPSLHCPRAPCSTPPLP